MEICSEIIAFLKKYSPDDDKLQAFSGFNQLRENSSLLKEDFLGCYISVKNTDSLRTSHDFFLLSKGSFPDFVFLFPHLHLVHPKHWLLVQTVCLFF